MLKNFNEPINNWNVSSVTDMKYMFRGTDGQHYKFDQPLNNWDVSTCGKHGIHVWDN